MTGAVVDLADRETVRAAAVLALDLLRAAATELADSGATDPTIQRHIANVCNVAIDRLQDAD